MIETVLIGRTPLSHCLIDVSLGNVFLKHVTPVEHFQIFDRKILELDLWRGSPISKWGSPISKFCLNSSKNDMGWIQTSNYSKI